MADPFADLFQTQVPTADRPLLGLTVLVVEDSRFACEAMRLMCLRSGARIRRADCLRSARRHLATYRPTVVIVDLGLPDGSGLDLVRDLRQMGQRVQVVLATSGDSSLAGAALAAGADGFLEKPLDSLAAFQQAILSALPVEGRPRGPRAVPDEQISPDRVALRDDLSHAAQVLEGAPDDGALRYLAHFLTGVARSVHDAPLEDAAAELGRSPHLPIAARVSSLVRQRLATAAVL